MFVCCLIYYLQLYTISGSKCRILKSECNILKWFLR